jgi:hypothetical protein
MDHTVFIREGRQAEMRLRPLARRRLSTRRPALVDIRFRNPCRRARFKLLGWNVRFTEISFGYLVSAGKINEQVNQCQEKRALINNPDGVAADGGRAPRFHRFFPQGRRRSHYDS